MALARSQVLPLVLLLSLMSPAIARAETALTSELAKQMRQGMVGGWGLQQLLLQETLTPAERKDLFQPLSEGQQRALEDAVIEVIADNEQLADINPAIQLPNNNAATFQFARAAAATAILAAARVTERGIK